uniref:ribonuclease P n=2 Tax=Lygus hesperus TaxID=30085 RepID=A0A0A9WNQ5_LYGHE
MASSKTGVILNLLRQTNFRLNYPTHLLKGLAHTSVRPGDSTSKKTTKAETDYQVQKSIVAEFLEKGNLAEVDLLKKQVLNAGVTLNKFTFDAHFIGICSELGAFELGRDYFRALHSKGNAGVGAVSRYFTMCHAFPDKVGPSEQEFMLKVYDELLKKYDILDVSTCEGVALGIGLTERWRSEIPRLLDMIKHSGMSPSPTLWVTAVESAFHHRDHKLAWEYMDAYANSGKTILPKLYEIVLKQKNILPQLLRWLERHGIILTVESAEVFMRLAPSHGAKTKSSLVSRKGSCKACRRSLEPSRLTPEDFELLRSAFLDPVLVGRDVFQKTSPEELNSFHKFLEKVLPVDVVLDGLNIAYVSKKLSPNGAKLLRFVTSHFVSEGRKILVVGRKHMDRWSTNEMNYVKSNASVFLAENTSEDDPFLLYAALKSGIGLNSCHGIE